MYSHNDPHKCILYSILNTFFIYPEQSFTVFLITYQDIKKLKIYPVCVTKLVGCLPPGGWQGGCAPIQVWQGGQGGGGPGQSWPAPPAGGQDTQVYRGLLTSHHHEGTGTVYTLLREFLHLFCLNISYRYRLPVLGNFFISSRGLPVRFQYWYILFDSLLIRIRTYTGNSTLFLNYMHVKLCVAETRI